jgi:hypothetical protein
MPTAIVVAASTELRIAQPDSWPPVAPAMGATRGARADDPRQRISLDELHRFLTVAWHMVTEVLPTVVASDPASERPAGCPLVKWELWAARHDDPVGSLSLLDLVDFSPFLPGGTAPPSGAAARPQRPLRFPLSGLPRAAPASLTVGPRPGVMRVVMTGPLELGYEYRSNRARVAIALMAQRHGFRNARENW